MASIRSTQKVPGLIGSGVHRRSLRRVTFTGEVEVFLNPFEEKLDEDETEGTIYARIPASLRRKIEAAAEAEGLSANSWASTVDHDPLPSATPRLKTVGNAVHRWC